MAKTLVFGDLMKLLYGQKAQIVSLRVRDSIEDGESVTVGIRLNGETTDYEVRDSRGIEHLIRFKRAVDPKHGPRMMKVRSFENHWQNWDDVTRISQRDRDHARRALLAKEDVVDFPWADLIHEAMQGTHRPFDAKFAPLREHHTKLLAHVELLGLNMVRRLDKAESKEEFSPMVSLVRDTSCFFQGSDEFLPRILDVRGGPWALMDLVGGQLHYANQVVQSLASNEKGSRVVNLYAALATYTTVLEALRVPLALLSNALHRTWPHQKGKIDGSLSELLEYLSTHPRVGNRYSKFLDADLRHAFAHARFRISNSGVEIRSEENPMVVERSLTSDEVFDRVRDLVVLFGPVAMYGSLLLYYLDLRIMMQSTPYAEWLVALGNVKP